MRAKRTAPAAVVAVGAVRGPWDCPSARVACHDVVAALSAAAQRHGRARGGGQGHGEHHDLGGVHARGAQLGRLVRLDRGLVRHVGAGRGGDRGGRGAGRVGGGARVPAGQRVGEVPAGLVEARGRGLDGGGGVGQLGLGVRQRGLGGRQRGQTFDIDGFLARKPGISMPG